MLEVLLFEDFLFTGRPDVEELSALVDHLHVLDEAVVVLVRDFAFLRVEEDRGDDGVTAHFFVLEGLLLEVVHYLFHVGFGFYPGAHAVKPENSGRIRNGRKKSQCV